MHWRKCPCDLWWSNELEKLRDWVKAAFEELLQFHKDGVNAEQDGVGNLEKTNFDFDVSGDAGVLD